MCSRSVGEVLYVHAVPSTKAKRAKWSGGGSGPSAGKGAKREQLAILGQRFTHDPPHDELVCGICHDLLTGAMQTPFCGGLSCKECIEAVAATANACPHCRAERLHARTDLRPAMQPRRLRLPRKARGAQITRQNLLQAGHIGRHR